MPLEHTDLDDAAIIRPILVPSQEVVRALSDQHDLTVSPFSLPQTEMRGIELPTRQIAINVAEINFDPVLTVLKVENQVDLAVADHAQRIGALASAERVIAQHG